MQGIPGPPGPAGRDGGPLTDLFDEKPRTSGDPAAIPRALGAGVEVPLVIDYNGVLTDIAVMVDITHPDISQLRITLIAPNDAEFLLFDGSQGPAVEDLKTTFPTQTQPQASLDPLLGTPAQGQWILKVVDSDQANPDAVRAVNAWGLNLTRRADNAWRLNSNLVVEGVVEAETLCKIAPLVQDGQAVAGAITLTCGQQPPVRLTTFQCGNNQIDPAETDDGNFVAGDGCDPGVYSDVAVGASMPMSNATMAI